MSVVTLQIQTAPTDQHQPLSPTRSSSTGLRKVMRKFFKSSAPSTPNEEPSLDRKSRFSRSSNLLVPDDPGSRRGKSLDGRPSLSSTNIGATSSAVHLPCADSKQAKGATPPSSFRQRFRPKSLQPLPKPSSQCPQSAPAVQGEQPVLAVSTKSQPLAPNGTASHPHAPGPVNPAPITIVLNEPLSATDSASTPAEDEASFGTPKPRAPDTTPIAVEVPPPPAPSPSTDTPRDSSRTERPTSSSQRRAPPTRKLPDAPTEQPQLLHSSKGTIAPVLTSSPASISIALPDVTPALAPPSPTAADGRVSPQPLRLRVEPSALPPRLPSLPGPSSFGTDFFSGDISGLPNNAYDGDHGHPAFTPQPPGAFAPHVQTTHLRSQTFSIGSPSNLGPMSPRRLTNSSTPGTYVMPSEEGASYTMMKMTPSLVMTRPASVIGPTTPMRYGSLLVSGLSTGESMGRSRTASESGPVRSATVGPMRSALPALRRDGSSFYMNMPGPSAPAAASMPAEDDDDDDASSDGTMDMEGMDEDDRASDDETEEGARTPAPAKSIVAKAVQAMAKPLMQPPSPSSYFRRQASESVSSTSGEARTPVSRREPSATSAPMAHRLSLVASGAPSQLLSTVQDDQAGEADEPVRSDTLRAPKAQATPASNRETLYHTPVQTPTPGLSDTATARGTIYFDAESGVEDQHVPDMPDPHAVSTFTTASAGSTSTVTRPSPPKSTGSTSTIRPEISIQTQVHATSSSALGLHMQASTPSRGRSGAAHHDYFSPRGAVINVSTPTDGTVRGHLMSSRTTNPRTPGGRPALYSQLSHSMLDFSSMGMGGDEPAAELSSPKPGKGKEKEMPKEARAQSPGRTVKQRSPVVARRMSLPDMSGLRALPPPYPKYSAREEEGKEVLPRYTCRIHFEASVMRKMEFTSPGLVARDRGWKRVYLVLNGTSLWVYKNNPRMYPIKPRVAASGSRLDPVARPLYPPGGRRGDGIVDLEDVVVGAPHVHLPEDILPTVNMPVKKSPTRGSGSSVNGGSSSGASRRSMENGRRSSELPRRSTGASRSSASSSSNVTSASASTAITSPGASGMLDLIEDDFAKSTSPITPGPTSVLGAQRPSNSQSNYPGAGSSLLASFQSNAVLRQFSLANAETGLASDYLKRKNVIRVRADGEQFLIQADNVLMAIDWIETFQAGANVALDLDERTMPKPPALPRRRRRRRATAAEGDANLPASSRDPQVTSPASPSQAQDHPIFGRRREAVA